MFGATEAYAMALRKERLEDTCRGSDDYMRWCRNEFRTRRHDG